VKLDPGFAEAYGDRGIARCAKGEMEGALGDYNRAIELNPSLGTVYFNRAFIFKEKGDLRRAFADYDRAVVLNPHHADAWAMRGLLNLRLGTEVETQADFAQFLRLTLGESAFWSGPVSSGLFGWRARGCSI
jgi:tetratricopeptide (TPR) repeat protein